MSESTCTGQKPRTKTDAPLSNNCDDSSCATCGAPADGIDARDRLPTCADCAALHADGGLVEPASEDGVARLADLSGFQRDILWVLSHHGSLKGLAVKSKLQDYYGENVNHGRLYPNLDELVERGLIEKGTRDQRTNEYKLTADGKQALSRRRTWTDANEVVRE